MAAKPAPAREGERIAKAMARAGLCSRREAEAWIAQGRVKVNERKVASPALNVGPSDRVEVDGKPLPVRERTRLFLYNKPRGLVTTHSDPEARPTIFRGLPKHLPRVISVGRLDFNTEGLLLLTNDGGLARALELPATGWLRRYRVRAHGEVKQEVLSRLREGITIDGVRYGQIDAELDRQQGSNVWITFAIREGKNREVRNVLGALGLSVNRLIRVSFGPFQLGEIAPGQVEEVKTRVLREQLGEKLAKAAGLDFSAPVVVREAEPEWQPVSSLERMKKGPRRAAPASPGKPNRKVEKNTDAKRKPRPEPKRERGAHPAQRDRRKGGRPGAPQGRKPQTRKKPR